jgi:Na+/H+-translocating membrane pyrophosphatase
MFVIIFIAIEQMQTAYTAFAFLLGAVTSMVCGAIGMMVATHTNYRVTYCAKSSLGNAFITAYRGGCVMGFALVSIGLLSKIFFEFSFAYSYPHLR